jgi:hypothetical protein
MDREQWRPFLKRWSEEWIRAHDPENNQPLDEDVVRDGWLGFAPASADEIAAAEARLGCSLPPSLREFLEVTNGWRDCGHFIYRLAGTAELGWLRDIEPTWIDFYGAAADEGLDEEEGVTVLFERALQVSLEGDVAVMFLDPGDVGPDGEWAAYWLASWSGMGPERYDSFYDLMYHQYASFHSLSQPEGETRDRWEAQVEQARLDALGGEIDGPLAVLEAAQEFGLDRAGLLRFQMLAMLGYWHTVPLSDVVLFAADHDELLRDPLFTAELLPLLFAEDRLAGGHGRFTLEQLMQGESEPVHLLIAEYQARLRDPGFRLSYGNPAFDVAVHRIAESSADDAWPALREAISLWRPLSENHIAPVVLFADPVLAELISQERGREILSMRRGQGGGQP